MFRINQKVVCVDDSPDPAGRPLLVYRGGVYTVARLVSDWTGEPGVLLVEVSPVDAPGWLAARFRPIVERKTDISIYREILNRETADA